jgi:DNA-binding MarR family transcriptional regulator
MAAGKFLAAVILATGFLNAVPSQAALRPTLAHDSFDEDDITGSRAYLEPETTVRGHRFRSDHDRAAFLKGLLRCFDLHERHLPGIGKDRDLMAVAHPIFIAHLEGKPVDVKSVRLLSGLPAATAHRKIQRLIDLGYVSKVRRKHDLRRVDLVPTEAAALSYRRGSDAAAASVDEVLKPIKSDSFAAAEPTRRRLG